MTISVGEAGMSNRSFVTQAWRIAATVAIAFCATAQAAAPATDLVTATVDVAQRATLHGHRVEWANAQNDRGSVAPNVSLSRLGIALARSPANQQAFDRLLREQQDPASPNYHHWLSPTEVGERFGASAHDIDAVSNWLRGAGLHVDSVTPSRTRILFSGDAAAVTKAFATPLHVFADAAGTRIANTADPQVPAALAGVVASVRGLSSVRLTVSHPRGQAKSSTSLANVPQPAASNCSGGTCSYAVFPADFAKIYNVAPVYAQGISGAGQTIAIVGRSRLNPADMTNFASLANLTAVSPTIIVPPDGTDPGGAATTCTTTGTNTCSNPSDAVLDQGEATLDVQRASSVAPGAAITLIVSADQHASDGTLTADGVDIAVDYAINTEPVPAKILSISFTSCEDQYDAANAGFIDTQFAQAAIEGISVFVSSGDGGVAGCAALDSTPTSNEIVSVNMLCSSAHVTCVGGTEFADTANPSAYWSATNASGFLSALGYIPEGAWNDPLDSSGTPQVAASGGGPSLFIAKPSWQTVAGVPGGTKRYTPDVSFVASSREGYFTCVAAEGGSCAVVDGRFGFLNAGGTSASAPSMAGVAALLNQKTGSAQANLNPRLYALAGTTSNGVFHDVTLASSGVSACSVSTPSLCNNSTPGPSGLTGGLRGYQVGTGYDAATGLGSIDVANLLALWSGSSSAVNLDQRGLTGSWADPSAPGQGIVLEIYPDHFSAGVGLLFGGWFTYDANGDGGKRWFTLQGAVDSASPTATIPLYVTEGGSFAEPQTVTTTQIGTVTIGFTDCMNGFLSYAFTDGSGLSGTMPLTRLTSSVTCGIAGNNGEDPSDTVFSGAWSDAVSGQGFVFEVSPVQNVMFAAWYTYAAGAPADGGDSSQRWYTLQADFTPGSTSASNFSIYETSGGSFDLPNPTTTVPVGTASLTFNSCTTATLTYAFTSGGNSGQHGTRSIERIVPEPDCTF